MHGPFLSTIVSLIHDCVQVYSVLSSLKSTKFQVFIQCRNIEENEVFRKIGQISLGEEEIGFCLKTESTQELIDERLKVENIFPYATKSARNVTVIKILIQDTKMKRAPVLKSIEVLGVPSFRCSLDDIADINRYLINSQNTQDKTEVINRDFPEADESFNIPEEFLDAITHELLVMPYILPSGSVIDESTMKKHNEHEESYGRMPSDPFTGMIYTYDSKPRFNESLKFRLDEFKLRNSEEMEVAISGRTVGTKRHHEASASNSGTSSGHISKKIKFYESSSSDLDSLIGSFYKNNQVSVFTKEDQSCESNEEKQRECGKCKTKDQMGLYIINLCSHIFCKPCLLQMNSRCEVCKITFKSKDVEKKHF